MIFTQAVLSVVLLGHVSAAFALPFVALLSNLDTSTSANRLETPSIRP